MKLNKGKKRLLLNIFSCLLVLIVTFFIALQFRNVSETEAAPVDTIEIKVNKVTTVSIYVFGPGVEFVSSTSNYDTYTADVGTTVRLQAVNETRIFTEWSITKTKTGEEFKPTDVVMTNSIINVFISDQTENLTVTVNRRDALAEDYGKYMLDRYVIVDENDLISLQNIIAGKGKDSDFERYYENPISYDTDLKKANIRKALQYGYFLIANNFTVFNEEFTGIGTKDFPFQGIMCGKNGNISKLFITITVDEESTNAHYGLFKFLGNEAVIRNLKISTSIGVDAASGTASTKICAGGLAAEFNKSTLVNVEVSASIAIESNFATKIYAGGLAGKMTSGTGIDSISDVVFEGSDAKWSLISHKQNSEIHVGMVSGTATDSYIKEIDIIASDLVVDLKNDAVEGTHTNSKLYLGNIFGSYYANATSQTLDDIMIMGDSGENLHAITTNGDAMVGGLIGYVDASMSGTLNLERIYFRVLGGENLYSASTINPTSVGNAYSGGVLGYVKGNNVYALDLFKNRLETIKLEDGSNKLDANYLFMGDYRISSVQNGKSISNTTTASNGKAIAAGLVAKGLINLNGTNEEKSSLAMAAPNSNLVVEAIQTKTTSTNSGVANDKEHACAALIYGSVGNTSVQMSNIDVYSNNTTIQTIREIGSKALGDLHTGGFISYASGSEFLNINMYLNDSLITAESLSFEAKNTVEDTNSAFCGGFSGELLAGSKLTNLDFAGFDTELFNIVGTTSCVESIQNTIPGGNNYMGENYIGGVVGRIQTADLTNCKFIGSESNEDHIKMSGHESPDSAFCGGVVGLIRTDSNGGPSTITSCEVIDTEVIGNATCIITYGDPDIYTGGIVGSAYIHETTATIVIDGCRLTRSTVYSLGNERIASFAGGIIGGSTWQSSIAISDCYVMESSVKANVTTRIKYNKTLQSTAGGIMGGMKGTPQTKYVNINNCAVIDTDVDAEVNSADTTISAYAAGILGFMENANSIRANVNLSNCYSNAYVTAYHEVSSGTQNVYGITFDGTIKTGTKQINATVDRTIYLPFEYNGFEFVVVSEQNGTYRIKNSSNQYIRISSNRVRTTTNAGSATTFTYNPSTGYLTYNSRFINFSGTTIQYSTSGFNFNNTGVKISEVQSYSGLVDVEASNSYYLKKNVSNSKNSYGTALGTGPFNIISGQTVSPYSGYDFLYGFDGFGQKFYIEIIDSDSVIKANNAKDQVHSITSTASVDTTALAHIWINAKTDGGLDSNGNLIVPSHKDKEKAALNGWFILDYVVLYSGSITNIVSDISNLETSYVDGNKVYKHQVENGIHYVVNKNNKSDRIKDNYAETSYTNTVDDASYQVKKFTFKVYDNMLAFNADFELTHFGANYQLRFLDKQGEIIDDAVFAANYGEIELKLIEKHSTTVGQYKDRYHLEFKPNENIEEDAQFFIRFIGGNNAVSAQTIFEINLIANKLILVGVTYADYTPPLNYFDTSGTLGSSENPYRLHVSSTTKFIPIFTKSNDIRPQTEYILEDYIEKCNYSIDTAADAQFDIHSNGELVASGASYEGGQLTVTHKKTGKAITVFFSSSRDISVIYSVVGSDVSGLTHASNTADFYFEQEIRSNYSGKPDKFTITIENQEFNLQANPSAYLDRGIKVYAKMGDGEMSDEPITSYHADYTRYKVVVDKSLLGNNVNKITVEIEYPVVCIITFKLQCEGFKDMTEAEATKSYKIIGGTKFSDVFKDDLLQRLNDWTKSAEVFGYVFTGYYLVNDANSSHSYGISFADLIKSDYKINSSNTFYARWSYLVELVEAPGTHIKTGFNSEFMVDYKGDDFTRTIQIPINNNQGYLFRIDKDRHYIGEVGIEASIVKLINGVKTMEPVPIENYQGNKNLYYVRPEYITGYLVIMTTVGNSEVIVGEHTSSVTENITPEDGILTFKYVVNHYYDADEKGPKSYIFNLANKDDNGNLLNYKSLKKEFVLDFYKQSTHEDLKLPDFTEIRVYYNCYVNGSLESSNTLVGTYICHNDDRVFLTEFKMLDLETPVFGNDITFESFFKRYVGESKKYSVTEVYYFSIIPPNGYSEKVQNEMANYVVECGYCEYRPAKHIDIEYLKGVRTVLNLANPDLEDVISNNEYINETSRQNKVYHVIPTRDTYISENNGVYKFVDNNTYSLYDIILTNTQKFPDFNYISLYDQVNNQSLLESSELGFNIKELKLRLGYRLGNVKIYGKRKTLTGVNDDGWDEIGVIEVTSAIYQDYIIDFKNRNENTKAEYPYYAFKIDNISSNEIRVNQIDVTSATNGVVYDGPITSFSENGVVEEKHTYTLKKEIIGDSRHNGKSFMLAIQLADGSNKIVENIEGDIYLEIKDIGLGINHYVYLNDYLGKNVAYINLSKIIKTLNVKEIDFVIHVENENYKIHSVQLLEVVNEYKPASGEVRDKLINTKPAS